MGTLAILFLCAAFSLVGCKGPDFSRRYSAMGVKHPELDPHVPIYGGLRLGLKPTGFMSPGLGVGLAGMIANKLADKIGLSSFHARLAAFQNRAARTNPDIAVGYEELFGHTPPEWYDEAGNIIWDRAR